MPINRSLLLKPIWDLVPVPDRVHETVTEARACTLCAPLLPLGPKPILQVSASAKLLIIGQAPGTKAHLSGVPWNDQSGKRLREWIGLNDDQFYDDWLVAIVPASLCYPGASKTGGDNPPMPACAPLWHPRIIPQLSQVRLTLLVGLHAQKLFLGNRPMAENVQVGSTDPRYFPLPHPSWRVTIWMRRNSWFETDVLPRLRLRVENAIMAN